METDDGAASIGRDGEADGERAAIRAALSFPAGASGGPRPCTHSASESPGAAPAVDERIVQRLDSIARVLDRLSAEVTTLARRLRADRVAGD